MGRVYVKVLNNKCCGYTSCADICPEVFNLDEYGFAFVEDDQAPVPEGLAARAIEAAGSCPESAILVSEHPQ